MRALIMGIIGAAASSAAWLAFEHSQQQSYGWLVCLVGLVTGVCVHSGAKGPSGGTLRGALAALLTLGGIVGGQKAYASWMQSRSTANEAVAVATIQSDTADQEGDEEADDAAVALEEPPRIELPESMTDGGGGYSKTAMKKNLSEWDMVWMSLAALAAYITGKGGEKAAPVAAAEEPASEPEPAADSQDDAADDTENA